MKVKILLPLFVMLTLSACSEEEPETLWLKDGVWILVEGSQDRFYPEKDYLLDESCGPNKVMVENTCKVAIFVKDLRKEGFRLAAIVTNKPEQFKLLVLHDSHIPLTLRVAENKEQVNRPSPGVYLDVSGWE